MSEISVINFELAKHYHTIQVISNMTFGICTVPPLQSSTISAFWNFVILEVWYYGCGGSSSCVARHGKYYDILLSGDLYIYIIIGISSTSPMHESHKGPYDNIINIDGRQNGSSSILNSWYISKISGGNPSFHNALSLSTNIRNYGIMSSFLFLFYVSSWLLQ